MVLTSRYTMDARNPAARREIAALADLVGAIRLPGGAHQRAAGTGVVTDLLILRRREPGRAARPDRLGAGPADRARRRAGAGQRVLPRPPGGGARPAGRGQRRLPGRRPGGHARPATRSRPSPRPGPHRRGGPRPRPDLGTRQPSAGQPAPAGARAARSAAARRVPARPRRTARSPRSSDGAERPHEVPAQPGRRAARTCCALARHRARRCWTPRPPPPKTPPRSAALRAELTRRYDDYLPALRAAEPVLAAPHRPHRPGHRRAGHGPGPRRRRAGSAATRSRRWSTRWRSSTRSASAPPRPPSSRDGSSPRAPRGWAPTPRPTRWPSAWTPAARPGWTRSPGCSAPPRTDARERARHAGLRRPGTGRLVPAAEYLSGNVRDKLRAAEQAAGDDPRFEVNAAELRAVIPRRPDARGDRRPARRGLDRRRVRAAVPARDPR